MGDEEEERGFNPKTYTLEEGAQIFFLIFPIFKKNKSFIYTEAWWFQFV